MENLGVRELAGTVGMAKSRVSLVEKFEIALLDAPAISFLSPVSVDMIPV